MATLRGKTVLVTGAAAGIGREICRLLAMDGARIVAADINREALDEIGKELEAAGVEYELQALDVSNQEAVESFAAGCIEKSGAPDVVINNAGVGHNGEIATTSIAAWDRLWAVNFRGPLMLTNSFLPAMKQRGSGAVVNVSSGQAFWRLPSWGAYAAIKSGLAVYSEILHFELRRFGISVSTVYPFLVNTGFYDDVAPDTAIGRMSMKYLRFYSHTPRTVAKKIVKAAAKGRRRSMVSILNWLGFMIRSCPPVAYITDRLTTWALVENKSENDT